MQRRLERARGDRGRVGVALEGNVGPLAELVAIRVGDTEQREDDLHRQRRREVLHEVATALRHERLEQADGGGADERLEALHPARREGAAHELPEPIVARRVEGDHHRRGLEHLRVQPLEDDAFRRAVGRPVDERWQHVAEARQGPELELLVAMERLVVAEPAVDRVRIFLELVREGVQLHAAYGDIRMSSARQSPSDLTAPPTAAPRAAASA